MKKHSIMILTACMMLILVACAGPNGKVVSEYDASTLGIDFVTYNNEAYDIGANKYGMPIFKDTDKAFEQALIDFAEGFAAIQKEFDLEPIGKKSWEGYSIYGWQLSTDNDEDIQKQGRIITQFFDIYENSF